MEPSWQQNQIKNASYKYLKAKDPNLAWGNPNMASNVQPIGQQKRISNAVAFNTKLQGIVNDLRSAGYSTMNEIAYRLNEMNITTRRGKPFTKNNLQRVLQYKG